MRASQGKFIAYQAWCKRCGNCVAFCPRQALAKDEWGRPFLARPADCTACVLCQMLCPDFAVSMDGGGGEQERAQEAAPAAQATAGPSGKAAGSPERLAPAAREEGRG